MQIKTQVNYLRFLLEKKMTQRQAILNYVATQYGTVAEYLWEKFPTYAVLRHHNKKAKWYALIAQVPKIKLGLEEEGKIDILNIKSDPNMIPLLQQDKNILPAYHMNKKHWITILLDTDFSDEDIYKLLDWSYRLTY